MKIQMWSQLIAELTEQYISSDKNLQCDGHIDCPDESDEAHCSLQCLDEQFPCQMVSGSNCYVKNLLNFKSRSFNCRVHP